MEEKLTISDEMVESFAEAIKSSSSNDIKFAYEILENRDKTNLKSEENFRKITKLMVSEETLFPSLIGYGTWVIKTNEDRILNINGRSAFGSEKQARGHLSRHLTNKIGTKSSGVNEHNLNLYLQCKYTPPGINQRIDNVRNAKYYYVGYIEHMCGLQGFVSKIWTNYADLSYDPNFDLPKFREEIKQFVKSQIPHDWRYDKEEHKKAYFSVMKQVFESGNKLRDFLLQNKIIKIEKLPSR